jgi:hypothetical protein
MHPSAHFPRELGKGNALSSAYAFIAFYPTPPTIR